MYFSSSASPTLVGKGFVRDRNLLANLAVALPFERLCFTLCGTRAMLHVRSRDGIKKDGEISIVGADRHAQAGQQPFGTDVHPRHGRTAARSRPCVVRRANRAVMPLD
jgi:hypothetical protein